MAVAILNLGLTKLEHLLHDMGLAGIRITYKANYFCRTSYVKTIYTGFVLSLE